MRHESVLQVLAAAAFAVAALFASAGNAAPRSPAEVFGFEPGDDYRLASYEQMATFYEQLAAASERVELRTIGESALGRPLYLLTISSPGNLADQERYRRISEQLARARIDADTARELAAEGRAVVWIDGGLHATEMAHGQMTPALAWRVATEESPEMQKIRDEVIFLLMPNMNPDGLEIVRRWYESQLDTPFQTTNPPELYHHYVGHDNNRDFFMNNMPESKAVARVIYNEWYPQIVYNQHQISPAFARIVIPPYSDPINPIIHPGVTTGLNEIGSAMGNRFAMEQMPGAIADVGFSMWWNGGMRTVPYFHNMIGILTETGHNWPTPSTYDPALFPRMRALRDNPKAIGEPLDEDLDGVPDATVLYPFPWEGGESRFSEPVDYMITASIAVLRAAADGRMKWLNNIYGMGRDAIEAGASGTRFYVIPAGQRHGDEAHNLVSILLEGGVEVEKASRDFRVGERRFAGGSFIVPSAQAFRPYVIDLLEKQVYPDTRLDPSGATKPPYDITGWTLPLQMGVEVVAVDEDLDVDRSAVSLPVSLPAGAVRGSAGAGYALRPAMNLSALAVNRLLRAGETVRRARAEFRAGRETWPAGTFFVARSAATADAVSGLAGELGLEFTALPNAPDVPLATLSLPRVGLYKSYVASMDEGWTRWLLESYGFDIVSLSDADMQGGRFDSLDAIIVPHPDGYAYFTDGVSRILTGHPPGTMPEAYAGGMGVQGAAALDGFVRGGGTLLTFGDANDFAIRQFGLPVRNVVGGAPADSYSIPGSLIRGTVDTAAPLAWGMPAEASLTVVGGAAFTHVGQQGCIDDYLNQGQCYELRRGGLPAGGFPQPVPHDAIVRYADDELLLSGWATGTEFIAGQTAMARVEHGAGEVVLYGFRPQFRGQPRGTYKLVFNALFGAGAE